MATSSSRKSKSGKKKTTKKSKSHRKTVKKHSRKSAIKSSKPPRRNKVSPLKTTNKEGDTSPTSHSTSDKNKSGDKARAQQDKMNKELRSTTDSAMKKLEDIQKEVAAPTKESSAKRSQSGTGNNPTPPEERLPGLAGTQATAAADAAAGAISAARNHMVLQAETDTRLKSDPRYERDQEVYKMGQEGKLGLVPLSDAEAAVAATRAGISEEVVDKIPKTAEEQVADDKRRLEEAKKAADKRAEDIRKAGESGSDAGESHHSRGTTAGTEE
jgi:hypothetical protein